MRRTLLTFSLLLLTTMGTMSFAAETATQPLQFESQQDSPTTTIIAPAPSALPGITWLRKTPLTIFDLGLLDLSRTASRIAQNLFDVRDVVADYRERVGKIALSFYTQTAYSPANCEFVARKMREEMFPHRENRAAIENYLDSFFSSYGENMTDRPISIGQELADNLNFLVFQPGGACELPLMSDELVFMKDDNYNPGEQAPKSEQSQKNQPSLKDIGKILNSLNAPTTLNEEKSSKITSKKDSSPTHLTAPTTPVVPKPTAPASTHQTSSSATHDQ